MTEAQINCFLSVVKEGSFSKAALAQYISQPAISKNVAKLEEELGFALVERKGNVLLPTPAGRKLAQFWQSKALEFENIIYQIKSSLDEPSGIINIGCPQTWNPVCFLNEIDDIFKSKYPNMKYKLVNNRLPNLMSDLQAGKLEAIITHEFYPQIQYGYESMNITKTGCGILFAKDFFPEVKTLADLKDYPLLVFDSDIEKQFINQMRKAFNKVGITPKIKNCGLYSDALFEMSCGNGIMVFTDWDIAKYNSAFTYLPLNSSLPVNLIYSKSASNRILEDFGLALNKSFQNNGGKKC